MVCPSRNQNRSKNFALDRELFLLQKISPIGKGIDDRLSKIGTMTFAASVVERAGVIAQPLPSDP
jgi:hypothetical protein